MPKPKVTRVKLPDNAVVSAPLSLPAETTLCIPVTIPPSANRLWRVGKGRAYKDPGYASWLETNSFAIRAARLPKLPGPFKVALTIFGGKGFNRKRDVDNALKGVLDLVRHAGLIPDDSVQHVRKVEAEYVEPAGKKAVAKCVVVVSAIQEAGVEEDQECR